MAEIIPKIIQNLPYVDRTPNPAERPDQAQITWIRNGECLGGAAYFGDNSGEMNRGPVQVQKNIVTLLDNDRTINSSLGEVITEINRHDIILGQLGDDNLAEKVHELELKVDPLPGQIEQNTELVEQVKTDYDVIIENIGTRDVTDVTTRSIYQDLLFVKERIGAKPEEDINGNAKPHSNPTGIYYSLATQGLGISKNERDIAELKDQFIHSDVGALKAEIDQIRIELGETPKAPQPNVYEWSISANNSILTHSEQIKELQDEIGAGTGESLDQRITANTINIQTNKDNIATNFAEINLLKQTVGNSTTAGTLVKRVQDNETNIANLQNTVGNSADEGLQGSVKGIVAEIGNDAQAGSVKGRLMTLEVTSLSEQRKVATLMTEVGNNTEGAETGIYKRLVELEGSVGDSTAGLKHDVDELKVEIVKKINDAPADDKSYARKNNNWIEITDATNVVEEAPKDGNQYLRKDGAWFNLFSEDCVIPASKKVSYKKSDTISLDMLKYGISGVTDTLTVGQANTDLVIAGKLKDTEIATNSVFKDQAGNHFFEFRLGNLNIGVPGIKTIISSSQVEPLSVHMNDADYQIWHEGNFADNITENPMVRAEGEWKELRDYLNATRGGWWIDGNTDITSCVKGEETLIRVGTPTEQPWTSSDINITGENIKYTGLANAVVDVRAYFEITGGTPTDKIRFALYKNGEKQPIDSILYDNRWTSDGNAYVFLQSPFSLSTNDVITIKAINENEVSTPATFVAKAASMYITKI